MQYVIHTNTRAPARTSYLTCVFTFNFGYFDIHLCYMFTVLCTWLTDLHIIELFLICSVFQAIFYFYYSKLWRIDAAVNKAKRVATIRACSLIKYMHYKAAAAAAYERTSRNSVSMLRIATETVPMNTHTHTHNVRD